MGAWGRQLAFAFRFFTRIPIPFKLRLTPGDIAGSAKWFPLVGFFEGIIIIITVFFGSFWIENLYLLALLCLLMRLLISRGQINGASHAVHGLFASRERVRIVEIMMDSDLGSMGIAAQVLDILLRYVLYQQLFFSMSVQSALPIILVACMSGKVAMSTAVGTSNSVFKRDRLIDDSSFWVALMAGASAALIAFILLGLPAMGLLLVLEVSMGLMVSGAIVLKLGGLTKQSLKLINELGELAFLYTMLIW